MPFFPLIRIILLTLGFYLEFISQIFPKLCAFEITGGFLCFHVHHLLPYSVIHGKVGLVWNAFMSFYLNNFEKPLVFANSCSLLGVSSPPQLKVKLSFADK